MMPDDLRAIVARMVAAGEPEAAIASVIKRHDETTTSSPTRPEPSLTDRVLADSPTMPWMIRAGLALARGIKAHPVASAAAAGAGIGTLATGGLAAPFLGPAALSIAGAGIGGAGGAGIGMLADTAAGGTDSPTTAGGVVKRMATEGATQAAFQGAGAALPVIGKIMSSAGKKAYGATLKPLRSIQAQNPTKDLVDIGITRDLPLRRSTLGEINTRVQGREGQIDAALAGNTTPVSLRESVEDATESLTGPGAPFRDLGTDRAKVGRTMGDLTEKHPDFMVPPTQAEEAAQLQAHLRSGGNPADFQPQSQLRDATAEEAQAFKQRLYGRIRKSSWTGELSSPEQASLQGVAGQVNARLKTAVPEIAPHLAEQSDLLAFQDALAQALPRMANNNMVPLESAIYLAANPTAKGAALALSRLKDVGDVGGRQLYKRGRNLQGVNPAMVANLLRALQVSTFGGAE